MNIDPGEKVGRLTVLRLIRLNGRTKCVCLCACGNETTPYARDIRVGKTQSCGCLNRERTAAASLTHGNSVGRKHSRTYVSWSCAKTRCTNPNTKAYPDYGGRGIKMCDRWLNSFENFLADMGNRPAGYTLERKDNNGNYEPGNCKWATKLEQANNNRLCHTLTFAGQTLNVTQWAKRLGFTRTTIGDRLRKGWPLERVLSPVDARK